MTRVEALFLLLYLTGAALLAIGSSFITPAGPWLVLGTISLVSSVTLAASALRSRR